MKVECTKNAHENGRNCARNGQNIHANPFRNTPLSKKDSELFEAWERGWRSYEDERLSEIV